MLSIRDSVHQLLEEQIQRLGLQAFYEVQKAEIIGLNCTSLTFHGLRDQSVHNIKSLEGADTAPAPSLKTPDRTAPSLRSN